MQAEEEGRVVASVVYTGEVYNFMELRDELKRLGHHFKISSDTELVLSLNVWLRLAPIGSKMGPDPPRSPCPRNYDDLHRTSSSSPARSDVQSRTSFACAMNALALSAIIFVLSLGGIFLGTQLRRTLPEHHLDEHAKDVVRLGVGLIATIAALVLGLLIAAAKASFDTQSTHLKHITADLILLDNILAQYGPEARPLREQMRSAIGPFADRLWREKEAGRAIPFETEAPAEQIHLGIQKLSPQSDLHRSLQSRAVQVSNDLAQIRFLLFVESENSIPTAFLAILAFWLVIIFASFSLFSPLNVTAFSFLSQFALSAACGIFLILELSQPFTGLLRFSSEPLRNALGPL